VYTAVIYPLVARAESASQVDNYRCRVTLQEGYYLFVQDTGANGGDDLRMFSQFTQHAYIHTALLDNFDRTRIADNRIGALRFQVAPIQGNE